MSNTTVEAKATTIPEPTPERRPDDLLVSILRTKRAHGSVGDTNFRMWLHAELKRLGQVPEALAEGCIMVRTDRKSDTLFSCHIDTVHSVAESDGTHQDLLYDPTFNQIFLQKNQKSGCLGADDGAGIYVMLKMIKAKVPGTYIFHTGEERGGIGSRAVLAKHRALLDDFSRAIAFDRKCALGDSPEVIVTQGGRACASTSFGSVLVAELNKHGTFAQPWVLSHGGSFTDTKVYADVIPECINLSCFYEQAHSPAESLDVDNLEALVLAVCKIKWDDLKASRKPAPEVREPYQQPMGGYGGYGGYGSSGKPATGFPTAPKKSKKGGTANAQRDFYHDDFPMEPPRLGGPKGLRAVEPTPPSILEELSSYNMDEFTQLAEEDPQLTARVMAALVMKNAGLQSQVAFFEAYLDVT